MSAVAQTISGHVTEADDVPVIGAGVFVKGTTRGTVTDHNGFYTIDAVQGEVLMFSSIGFIEKEIQVGQTRVIDVRMEPEAQLLDELVVVGYGTMKKSDVTASVTAVNMDNMKSFPAPNAAEMLRGRAPGVTVTSSSGRPGSVPTITIRGSRSISASNSPLYVIDGSVASDVEFSMLNSDDIKSIEILKDAAAQSIYGARASDGVILVTTKRGSAGEQIVNYSGYVGLQHLHRNFDFYSPEEWVALRREAVAHDMG